MSSSIRVNPMPPIVELRQTDVDIDGVSVLRGIDWRLDAGAHWGIIGANGSGKSTFLALIGGLRWPAPGRGNRSYDFGAGRLRDAVEARRRISLVGHELQNRYARFGWNFLALDVVLSGVTRTDIPQRERGPAAHARAMKLLQRFKLVHLAERRFLSLSRGEQRRVLIARSMAFDPTVLLLDEPGSGLDRHARNELDQLLATVGEHTTVVCAAHTADDLPKIVESVAELDRGRIVRTGSRESMLAQPSGALTPSSAQRSETTQAPSTALIEIHDADVCLDGRRVLNRVDWTLEPGRNWLVVGPNGAGKTTFLRLVNGQLRPAVGGTIRWPALGNPRSVWALRRQMGYVSAELQAAYRYPSTVAECVGSGFASSIGLTRRLSTDERERVATLLSDFELTELAGRKLTSLSYGQMHRVLLARTLANRPRVLLLDEPWEGLDAANRDLVLEQLSAAMHAGTQLVCASHLDEPRLSFSDVLRIEDGLCRAETVTQAG